MPYQSPAGDKRSFYLERPWAYWFGVLLAMSAGFINVVVIDIFNVPVSHVTGSISRLSIDLATGNDGDLARILGVIGGFVAGATAGGALIGASSLRPGRRYGVALASAGALLALATWMLEHGQHAGVAVAAGACGLQNAMYSSYHGLILRTTHLTGIVTDIGVLIGQWARHGRFEGWKLTLLAGIVAGFILGGVAGALAWMAFGVRALGIASAWTALAGLAYTAYKWRLVAKAAQAS